MAVIHCRIAWGWGVVSVKSSVASSSKTRDADDVRCTHDDNTIIIICAVAATLNRWGGESCEGWCERGNMRRRENAHERWPGGRARCGGCERGFDGKTLSRAVRLAAATGWGGGKLVRPSGGSQHAVADLDCSSAYARQSE